MCRGLGTKGLGFRCFGGLGLKGLRMPFFSRIKGLVFMDLGIQG